MSREIIFRAKKLNKNEFVIGYYLPMLDGYRHYIYLLLEYSNEHSRFEIDPKTLGQYTGLKDKNGKKIFEGDILKHTPAKEANYFVKYLTSGFYLCPNNEDYGEYFTSLFAGYDYKNRCNSIEIIGNIYENPELMGGEND